MSARPYRLPRDFEGPQPGRLIDREQALAFTFDGQVYRGFAGDTLASALMANGVRLVGRSFKYHRPRGVLTAGPEEPNALVAVGSGGRMTPNLRATMVELYEGLTARSQNRWPSLGFDLGQTASLAGRLLPAGFYYKTFMWPQGAWPLYERLIRQAAGLGPPTREPDPDTYEQIHLTCDVLVVGGGAAGLAAATAAAEAGARVVIAEETSRLGGLTDLGEERIDGGPALEWLAGRAADLAAREGVQVLTRTTVAGVYLHGHVLMAERLTDHAPLLGGSDGVPRERLWKVRPREIVVAAGAVERPLTFAGNDRPGVMLAGAARAYALRYGASPGVSGVVFTNNDDAYRTALTLKRFGVEIARIVDVRAGPQSELVEAARAAGIAISAGHVVADVETSLGGTQIRAVQIAQRRETGRIGALERVECDFVATTGGWSPAVQLTAHMGARPVWDERIAAPRPGALGPHMHAAGAANGIFSLAGAVAEGFAAGDAAGRAALGTAKRRGRAAARATVQESGEAPLEPFWFAPSYGARGEGTRHFLDFQNDVTVADVELAVREGYRSAEHLKRYTTLGMATDQGKVGNVNALAIHAEAARATMAELGTTTFRPPVTPLTFGAIAGQGAGAFFQPVRRTPVWHWHAGHGWDPEPVGLWRRPYCYRGPDEDREAAIAREVAAVRGAVGLLDASTLGKIEVTGPDAGRFLDLVYTNVMSSLAPERCRYGLMLNEEGYLIDDGVVARLGADRFLLHTTSGGADRIAGWLELWLQTEWPELRVFAANVTEQWAQFVVSGPHARRTVAAVGGDIDFAAEAFPFLAMRTGTLAEVPVRVFRISFTGELTFEIACPANAASHLWQALLDAGDLHGIAPFGTEALHVLRAEKGLIAIGDETDGTVTPHDLGLGWAVSKAKADFIGKRGLARPDLARQGRRQLVGLLTRDPARVLPDGAYALDRAEPSGQRRAVGVVTSTYRSPTLGRSIALALIEDGRARHGETVAFAVGRDMVEAEITEPAFYDRQGARQNV
jgi:sarcosine oxidase subunit alpha